MGAENVYIFGAHSRAQTLARYLQYLYPGTTIEAYLYDNDEENPEEVDGVKVLRLDQGAGIHPSYPAFIGTRGIYHSRITEKLKEAGFRKIYPVTAGLDLKLRNAYLEKYYAAAGRAFLKIGGLPSVLENAKVYVARSIYDKPLQQEYTPAPYEQEIQVGAAMTTERLGGAILTDDTGDHISGKNSQFCELTALYWIWKNAKEDIVGLAHYRRHFILPDDWVARMEHNGVDVILPVPLYVAPSLEGNFKMRHGREDWDYMMRCIEKDDKQMYQAAGEFFKENLYSPCNMFIMKKTVLDDLCIWLFPLLFRIAGHGGQKEDPYQNRYPGFLSERLISFFFQENREKYRVAYADKNFLS